MRAPGIPMMALSFVDARYQVLRRIQHAVLIAMGGILSAAVWLWVDGRTLEEQATWYEMGSRRVEETNQRFAQAASQEGLNVSKGHQAALNREVVLANQLIRKRAFSWTQLLSALEDAIPVRASLSSVAVNFADSSIALNGAVETLKDLTTLVTELEAHPAFSHVVLAQHHVVEASQGFGSSVGQALPQPIEFTLTVRYAGPPGGHHG